MKILASLLFKKAITKRPISQGNAFAYIPTIWLLTKSLGQESLKNSSDLQNYGLWKPECRVFIKFSSALMLFFQSEIELKN